MHRLNAQQAHHRGTNTSAPAAKVTKVVWWHIEQVSHSGTIFLSSQSHPCVGSDLPERCRIYKVVRLYKEAWWTRIDKALAVRSNQNQNQRRSMLSEPNPSHICRLGLVLPAENSIPEDHNMYDLIIWISSSRFVPSPQAQVKPRLQKVESDSWQKWGGNLSESIFTEESRQSFQWRWPAIKTSYSQTSPLTKDESCITEFYRRSVWIMNR